MLKKRRKELPLKMITSSGFLITYLKVVLLFYDFSLAHLRQIVKLLYLLLLVCLCGFLSTVGLLSIENVNLYPVPVLARPLQVISYSSISTAYPAFLNAAETRLDTDGFIHPER
jgi:hypothetical protein